MVFSGLHFDGGAWTTGTERMCEFSHVGGLHIFRPQDWLTQASGACASIVRDLRFVFQCAHSAARAGTDGNAF